MKRYYKTDYLDQDSDNLEYKLKKMQKQRNLQNVRIFCVIVFLLLIVVGFNSYSVFGQRSETKKMHTISTKTAVASNMQLLSIPSVRINKNPFLPYRNIDDISDEQDVPSELLIAPPEFLETGSVVKMMETTVSGILYDKRSATAILNIEGNDYLVKKGDVVNNYKVMDITQDSVVVMFEKNIYKAGIGEILTEGELRHNTVSNLDKKFGGDK